MGVDIVWMVGYVGKVVSTERKMGNGGVFEKEVLEISMLGTAKELIFWGDFSVNFVVERMWLLEVVDDW